MHANVVWKYNDTFYVGMFIHPMINTDTLDKDQTLIRHFNKDLTVILSEHTQKSQYVFEYVQNHLADQSFVDKKTIVSQLLSPLHQFMNNNFNVNDDENDDNDLDFQFFVIYKDSLYQIKMDWQVQELTLFASELPYTGTFFIFLQTQSFNDPIQHLFEVESKIRDTYAVNYKKSVIYDVHSRVYYCEDMRGDKK